LLIFDLTPSPLVAVITTDSCQLLQTPGGQPEAVLHVVTFGGRPPYRFRWSINDPAGGLADDLLDRVDKATVRFSAGQITGPYDIYCTVTDAWGRQHTASLVLRVGPAVGLSLTHRRIGVLAGGGPLGQATIPLDPSFVPSPVAVSWTCTAPDGKPDSDRLDTTNPLAARFTSSDRTGTYVLTATITDANGVDWVESITVVVGALLGLDIVAGRQTVLPGGGAAGMTSLLATPVGGIEPFSYDWEVLGPDGQRRNHLLWDTSVRNPVFESDEREGVYLARCAVTDADGTVLLGSAAIEVRQALTVSLFADRIALPADSPVQATLTADVRGGQEPVTIEWRVLGPSGEEEPGLLEPRADGTALLASPSQPGAYVVRATATDAAGAVDTSSVVLAVGGTLGVTVATDKTCLPEGGATPAGVAQLRAEAHGGEPPYAYRWSVVDPLGNSASSRLSSTAAPNPLFTSGTQIGTYQVFCTVTDAAGDSAVGVVHLSVGQPLNVDVTVDKQTLAAGGGVSGQAQLYTTVHGGAAPYAYRWSVTGPDNAPATARLTSTQIPNPVFTSAADTGTYRLTLTTVDALGVVFVDSVELVVGSETAGQRFWADVYTSRNPVPPYGESAVLSVTTVGGTEPLVYSWTVTDPDGNTDNGRLDSTSNQTVTFTSTATQGTYRVRCTITDAVGAQCLDSVQITVSDSFSLDVAAADTHCAPGATVSVFADRTGGAPNFTYAWNCLDESGSPAGTFTVGSTGQGAAVQTAIDDVTNAWVAPAAGAGSLGTYRIQVTLTDALGNRSTDSVEIVVQTPLSLDLTASDTFVLPAATTTLLADVSGGETPYSYAWRATDSSGNNAGTFSTGSAGVGAATQSGLSGDASNGWSSVAEGTFTVTCTVTDNAGQVFTDSVPVVVTRQQAFSLDLVADRVVVAPGGTVNLSADRTGGRPTFEYAWTARDQSGASAGTFGAEHQSGLADDATNTWTAPSGTGAQGTYRLYCTVTDAQERTATDSVIVEVGTLLAQNTFLAPPAASTDGLFTLTLLAGVNGPYPGLALTSAEGLTGPAHPRNVVVFIGDADGSITAGKARITGYDARGQAQTEVIDIVPPSGSGTRSGTKPFASVTQVNLYDFTGNDFTDTFSIGVGDKFGLTGLLSAATDVLYTNEGGTVLTSGFTVDLTAGQQGLTFANAPNGSRDYIVVFRLR